MSTTHPRPLRPARPWATVVPILVVVVSLLAGAEEHTRDRAPRSKAAFHAERELREHALRLALEGKLSAAWAILEPPSAVGPDNGRPGIDPALVGWRAIGIAGALRNQGRSATALGLVKLALDGRWLEAAKEEDAPSRAKALATGARLAEWAGDQVRAVELIETAKDADPVSPEIERARRRYASSLAEFPQQR